MSHLIAPIWREAYFFLYIADILCKLPFSRNCTKTVVGSECFSISSIVSILISPVLDLRYFEWSTSGRVSGEMGMKSEGKMGRPGTMAANIEDVPPPVENRTRRVRHARGEGVACTRLETRPPTKFIPKSRLKDLFQSLGEKKVSHLGDTPLRLHHHPFRRRQCN